MTGVSFVETFDGRVGISNQASLESLMLSLIVEPNQTAS